MSYSTLAPTKRVRQNEGNGRVTPPKQANLLGVGFYPNGVPLLFRLRESLEAWIGADVLKIWVGLDTDRVFPARF